MAGFKKFLLRGNVVDLAIAIIIGIAFGLVIAAFTKDIITPIIAAIGGKPDFSSLSFTINNSKFLYGDFINAVVSFLILALILYFFVVKPFGALMDRYGPSSEEPTPTTDCPHCKSAIPETASVCAFCTRDVTPATA
jgi:large conductance mechanosensitive channel